MCKALPTMSTRVKTKVLFVSHFSPEASTCHTGNFLKEQLKLSSDVGMRLKNKFNKYASLLISVTADEFPLICNTDVWPDGCLITLVYRCLNPNTVLFGVLKSHLEPRHLVWTVTWMFLPLALLH